MMVLVVCLCVLRQTTRVERVSTRQGFAIGAIVKGLKADCAIAHLRRFNADYTFAHRREAEFEAMYAVGAAYAVEFEPTQLLIIITVYSTYVSIDHHVGCCFLREYSNLWLGRSGGN